MQQRLMSWVCKDWSRWTRQHQRMVLHMRKRIRAWDSPPQSALAQILAWKTPITIRPPFRLRRTLFAWARTWILVQPVQTLLNLSQHGTRYLRCEWNIADWRRSMAMRLRLDIITRETKTGETKDYIFKTDWIRTTDWNVVLKRLRVKDGFLNKLMMHGCVERGIKEGCGLWSHNRLQRHIDEPSNQNFSIARRCLPIVYATTIGVNQSLKRIDKNDTHRWAIEFHKYSSCISRVLWWQDALQGSRGRAPGDRSQPPISKLYKKCDLDTEYQFMWQCNPLLTNLHIPHLIEGKVAPESPSSRVLPPLLQPAQETLGWWSATGWHVSSMTTTARCATQVLHPDARQQMRLPSAVWLKPVLSRASIDIDWYAIGDP